MKIYGSPYSNPDSSILLKEVTLVISVNKVIELANFASQCVEDARKNSNFMHNFFSYCSPEYGDNPDLIVFSVGTGSASIVTTVIYGRQNSDPDSLLLFKDVTLALSMDETRALANFAKQCAGEIGENPNWEHRHFSDYCPEHESGSDLIIFSKDTIL